VSPPCRPPCRPPLPPLVECGYPFPPHGKSHSCDTLHWWECRSGSMNKASRNLAAAVLATMAASVVTAGAQSRPTVERRSAASPSARSPVTGSAIAGTWTGKAIQVQSSIEYTVVLEITARGGQTSYPELNCGGKLTRVGASTSYVFFVETITRGPVEKYGRCSDGTVTVARAGDKLAWEWFGIVNGDALVAIGSLARNPDGGPL
jgi:hypothetical protein